MKYLYTVIFTLGLAVLSLIIYLQLNTEPHQPAYIFCLDPNSVQDYGMPHCDYLAGKK